MVVYVCYAACRPHVESRSWYTRYNTNHTLCRYSKIQDDPHHSFMFNVANRSYKIQSPNLTLSGVGGSLVCLVLTTAKVMDLLQDLSNSRLALWGRISNNIYCRSLFFITTIDEKGISTLSLSTLLWEK